MKTHLFFFLLFFAQFFAANTFASTDSSGFMTPRDLMQNDSSSNIILANHGSSATTVYGIYVRQFAYVTPGENCGSAISMYSATDNITAGASVMPITINAGKSAVVGSNYLYNMIYQAIYYKDIVHDTSPPGCFLPGCTWGNDSTIYNWCIYLAALAPVTTTAGYTSNVPPSTDEASSGSYNYNLTNTYVYLGPISCNDQTMTCTAASLQTQSFS